MSIPIYAITHDGGHSDFEATVKILTSTQDFHLQAVISEQAEFQSLSPAFRQAWISILGHSKLYASLRSQTSPLPRWWFRMALVTKYLAKFLIKPTAFLREKHIETELSKKHLWCFTDFLSSSNSNLAMILESDAGPTSYLHSTLELILSKYSNESQPEIFFLAEGFEISAITRSQAVVAEIGTSNKLLRTKPSTSNTACAYILNKSAARLISKAFEDNINEPADWLLSWAMQSSGIDSYHFKIYPIAHMSRSKKASSIRKSRI